MSQQVNSIQTSVMQKWTTRAFLRGLGFSHTRDADGDLFVHTECDSIEEVEYGWEPSKDGSRLTEWSALGDPESAHYQRRYIMLYVFRYTDKNVEVVNVLAWSSSPHQGNELYEVIAISSLKDWEKVHTEADMTKWLTKHQIKL